MAWSDINIQIDENDKKMFEKMKVNVEKNIGSKFEEIDYDY